MAVPGMRLPLLLIAAVIAGCSAPVPSPSPLCPPQAEGEKRVYVVVRDWHVELGIPVNQLNGALATYRDVFPAAHVIMFGYGKRTFFTAPADDIGEYLLGPIPGPSAIQVTGIAGTPPEAYPPGTTETLALSPESARALSAFIAEDLARDGTGSPRLLGRGPFPGSLFYAARSRYSLAHTCNTWVADALHVAGLPVGAEGVMLSGQLASRVATARRLQCQADLKTALGMRLSAKLAK